jgi:hypothetical protein
MKKTITVILLLNALLLIRLVHGPFLGGGKQSDIGPVGVVLFGQEVERPLVSTDPSIWNRGKADDPWVAELKATLPTSLKGEREFTLVTNYLATEMMAYGDAEAFSPALAFPEKLSGPNVGNLTPEEFDKLTAEYHKAKQVKEEALEARQAWKTPVALQAMLQGLKADLGPEAFADFTEWQRSGVVRRSLEYGGSSPETALAIASITTEAHKEGNPSLLTNVLQHLYVERFPDLERVYEILYQK